MNKSQRIVQHTILLFATYLVLTGTARACENNSIFPNGYFEGLFFGFIFCVTLFTHTWKKRFILKDTEKRTEKKILIVQAMFGCIFFASSIYIGDNDQTPLVVYVFILFALLNILFAILSGINGVRKKEIKKSIKPILSYVATAFISYLVGMVTESFAFTLSC